MNFMILPVSYVKVRRSPGKILILAKKAFEGKYTDDTIKKWLKVFVKRFFSQQFKRSCLPDGPKVGTISLSPRGDWRMPSDALQIRGCLNWKACRNKTRGLHALLLYIIYCIFCCGKDGYTASLNLALRKLISLYAIFISAFFLSLILLSFIRCNTLKPAIAPAIPAIAPISTPSRIPRQKANTEFIPNHHFL